jgi:hypothetical protein
LASKTTDHRRLLDTEVEQTDAVREAKRAKIEQDAVRQAQVQEIQDNFRCDVSIPEQFADLASLHKGCLAGLQQTIHKGV